MVTNALIQNNDISYGKFTLKSGSQSGGWAIRGSRTSFQPAEVTNLEKAKVIYKGIFFSVLGFQLDPDFEARIRLQDPYVVSKFFFSLNIPLSAD